MPGQVLTTASQVKCMHGGTAILLTSNTKLTVDNMPALLESDVHPVVGCPFTVGPKYSPCIRIEWSLGAVRMSSGGSGVLLRTSIGKCYNAEGAPQGIAIVASTQTKTTGT